MEEYVGLDVSKEETSFCAMDGAGKILAQGKVASDPESLFEALKEHTLCPARIVLETGTLSGWLARELRKLGLPADVIDARQAHAVMKLQHNKTDANDAVLLAGIARAGFCRPVSVASEAAQKLRILIKARKHLVSQRVATQNAIRGFLGSLGIRFPKGSGKLAARVTAALEDRPDLEPMIAPLLLSAEALAVQIAALDREVGARAKAMAACRLLMTVPGVGPVTALAYAATIGDAGRFAKSRDVGAYVGLTSRRNQSGEMDYSGRISKFGDSLLRSQLYEAANSLLTTVRKAHPLKDWARRIKKRTSHKKACVALARKLAVIMHRMLVSGEAFRWPEKEVAKKATATAS
ncbi:MAG: IS110 family transposase [Rhodospirillales bacterium]|jgi:transposase|nr:IS110 family transposase [Rhodospirillales bacterium]|tara:strand:- start:302 stop:1351 length:1050 start_codon:yes stop_codon:yes gene_type:complete